MKRACLAIMMLTLAACGKGDNEPGPGGVTQGEARALDDAAEMIDMRRPAPEAVQVPTEAASQPAG